MDVCLFDIDGTLLDTGGAGQAAMERALDLEFGITAPTQGISTAGRSDRAITDDLLKYHGIAGQPNVHARFHAAYVQQLVSALSARNGTVLPGVPELLAALGQSTNMALGLLTGNYQRGAQLKLAHYGLEHHFAFGGFGDHHYDRDDVAGEALVAAHKLFGGAEQIGRVWVIGDTPADIQCGRAIQATVIAVGTGVYEMAELEAARPDFLFADFSDLAAALKPFANESNSAPPADDQS